MKDPAEEPIQAETATRRAFLVRDLKAICAMATVPVVVQMMFPESASANDHRGGGYYRPWWDFWRFFDGHHGHDGHDGHGGGHGGHGGHGGGQCFLKGTRILTAAGERNVEDLAVGDLLPTVFGGTRPVHWIGRLRRVRSDARKPWAKVARPVRIARSALAPNVPHSDLYVTQGHALLFDDILIPAGSLINDTTISLYPAEELDELEFFHVKLETHDVIHAEGAPCETLLRVDETMSNFVDYFGAHGTAEAPGLHCAPIICNGPRRELSTRTRSLMSPWLGPQKFDEIRTRLELRAMALSARNPTPVACWPSLRRRISA